MKRAFWTLALCIPAIACGQDIKAIHALESACGQGNGKIKTIAVADAQAPPQIVQDQSLVYFVQRDSSRFINNSIAVDGQWVTELRSRSHFAMTLPPGEHHLCLRLQHWQSGGPYISLLHVNLQPRQIYYIGVRTTDDGHDDPTLASQFKILDPDEGKFLVDATRKCIPVGQATAGGSQ